MITLKLLFTSIFVSLTLFVLAKNDLVDKVVMFNGEEKVGNVIEIGDDFVKVVP